MRERSASLTEVERDLASRLSKACSSSSNSIAAAMRTGVFHHHLWARAYVTRLTAEYTSA